MWRARSKMAVSEVLKSTTTTTNSAPLTPSKMPSAANSPRPQLKRTYGDIVLSLENCLLPPERLENTPSVQDGLDAEVEAQLRFFGCELIQSAGILLRLPQVRGRGNGAAIRAFRLRR